LHSLGEVVGHALGKSSSQVVPPNDRDRVSVRGRVGDRRAGTDVLRDVPDDVRECERGERDGNGRRSRELPSLDPREVTADGVHLADRRARSEEELRGAGDLRRSERPGGNFGHRRAATRDQEQKKVVRADGPDEPQERPAGPEASRSRNGMLSEQDADPRAGTWIPPSGHRDGLVRPPDHRRCRVDHRPSRLADRHDPDSPPGTDA
jgi:hypothetical protein